MRDFLEATRTFYGKFERPISSLSLIAGFVFDAFALTRIDAFWENFWVVIHLLIVAIFIILININKYDDGDEGNPHSVQANKTHASAKVLVWIGRDVK